MTLLLVPTILSAQGVIAGRVTDAASAEPRAGTAVSIVGTTRGAIADADGRFIISSVPVGATVVRARLLGYKTIERPITVAANDTTRIDFALAPEATMLNAIRSEARPIERDLFESKPSVGTVQITARAAEGVPTFGEADIIRIVQLLPGVEARNDFSTGLNVRGGESDQNLILLDGFPIYNPFHLGGLFSTFIDPTVRDVTLITGGFPARYGGRLSSVLDVHSVDEVRPGLHGTAEVSVLASTLSLGSSFDSGKGSWMIAGRRTYADKFISLISSNQLPYHFRDEQAHFTYSFTPTLKLAFTAYDGRDQLDASIATFGDSTTGATASGGAFDFGWGNTVVGASLTKTLNNSKRNGFLRWLLADSTTLEQRASRSVFSTSLNLGDGALTLFNRVGDVRLAGSVSAHGARHERSFGYDIASYGIKYDAGSEQTQTSLYNLDQNPTSGAVYVDDMWHVSNSFLLETGVRGEALTGRDWTGVSPRVSAKYFLTKDFALTGAVGKFAQWTHSLAREDIPVRLFDFWLASDASLPVSTAWHYVLGSERWFSNTRYARVEGFYKKYSQLLEGNPQEDPNRRGDEFLPADGDSYGVDFMLRQFESGR
ncbi:MAG TPA: TonB-dependent receptor, partial [Gemmatimonadaceae bacterium]